jgi:hypothetical protein
MAVQETVFTLRYIIWLLADHIAGQQRTTLLSQNQTLQCCVVVSFLQSKLAKYSNSNKQQKKTISIAYSDETRDNRKERGNPFKTQMIFMIRQWKREMGMTF